MNSKNILITARNRGFGPISKGETIASWLKDFKVSFLGESNALEYAKQSPYFSEVFDSNSLDKNQVKELFKKCNFCISVMEQDYAMLCIQMNIDYYFFDSLFGFWEVKDEKDFSLKKLNKSDISQLSSHEKKLAAHKFSKRSFIQKFYGVNGRYSKLKNILTNSTITQPIISLKDNLNFKKNPLSLNKFIIFNLGGLTSTKQPIEINYYKTIRKVVLRILEDNIIDINHIMIVSGYKDGHEKIHTKKGKSVEHSFIKNDSLLKLIDESEMVITAPGLTSILEATALRKNMIIGFEQHKSHKYNLENLKESPYKKNSFSIQDYIPKEIFDISNLSTAYYKILKDKKLFEKMYQDLISLIIDYPQINYDRIESDLTENTISNNDIKSIIINQL